jgi:formylmethanofuran dehydrogenase subunit E
MLAPVPEELSDLVDFHGDYCPGLVIGYRVTMLALRELGVRKVEDEKLVAICETNACPVDAIKFLTGCLPQRGNLIVRNRGKQVFAFGRSKDDKMIRIALRPGAFGEIDAPTPSERRRIMLEWLWELPDDQLFDVRWEPRSE